MSRRGGSRFIAVILRQMEKSLNFNLYTLNFKGIKQFA
jgi:hypothetical protein